MRSWAVLSGTLLVWQLATAQYGTPSNFTAYNSSTPQNSVVLAFDSGCTTYGLIPLTTQAFSSISVISQNSGYKGYMNVVTPNNTENQTTMNIGYVNCEPSAYPGNISQQQVVSQLITKNLTAIVFFSTTSAYCNLTLPSNIKYNLFYSMGNALQAEAVLKRVNGSAPEDQTAQDEAFILTKENLSDDIGNTCSCAAFCAPNGTTAVAMIILYSITGVITALFLLIIISGAIRAHRHPERYGPRHIIGRPRQSRAKGLARAMLDTLPIVKFGEREPPKDADTELSVAQSSTDAGAVGGHQSPPPDAQATSGTTHDISSSPPLTSNELVNQPIGPAESADANGGFHEDALGCSICTEDFENGQDIRVLPCNHKFHPACVDPWLLDVSGTCPLCRVDLRPATARSEADEGEDTLPPPLAFGPGTRRRDVILNYFSNRRNLHSASPEERLQAIRRYRQETRAQTGSSQATTETGAAPSLQRLAGLSRLMRRGRDRESSTTPVAES